uniref:Uncharacterized protein n=1 Tax=Arundo donax TaxID=35708 RepID=A0A0A8ZQW2_ARUDO
MGVPLLGCCLIHLDRKGT